MKLLVWIAITRSNIGQKYMSIFFCFGHNFLADAYFLKPFLLVIYIFWAVRLDIHNAHIYDHILANQVGYYGHFRQNGHYVLNNYVTKYGRYGCRFEEW